MKVLLDEDLPHELRPLIPNHDVFTVQYVGWASLKNGHLLAAAQEAEFDVFVTGDQSLIDQQNLKGRRFGVVVLRVQKIDQLLPYLAEIVSAIDASKPETVTVVACGVRRG